MISGLQVVQVNRLRGDDSCSDASGPGVLITRDVVSLVSGSYEKKFRLNLLTHDIQDSINQVSPMQAPPASRRCLRRT